MQYIKKMNESIDYIEDNILEDLKIDQIAKVACLSKFHFQRMFHMLTGVTIAEYIRKRRITLAAQELAVGENKIIDLAIKYRYSTAESFSRAFRKMQGISPSNVNGNGNNLKAYPRLSFQLQLKGAEKMNYRIVKKESFKIIGRSIRVSTVDGENYKTIPEFWQEINNNGYCERLSNYMGELGILGVCMDYDPETEKMTYMAAVEKPVNRKLELEVEEKEIPAATWAVFEAVGKMPDAIQKVWKRIYSEWFPSTGYEHAGGPELEVYLPGNPDSEDYKSEIWIPIKNNI